MEERLIQIRPTTRQLAHQSLEFYAFVHFTVNTFTDKEWGDGTESPQIFNPVNFDAEQWVTAIKSAGMKGLILTCKHHDGFCLWPSKYTDHTIASSPFQNGKGDIVKDVSAACKKHGIKFGVYLSPWDRNSQLYGTGTAYDDYFCNQLTELLTGYGDVFSVWFDGACGEGPNGKKQFYDFERYYSVIRKLQPMACISVCGPDVRWCGNEAGHCRKAEWSVVPLRTKDTEIIKEHSQQEDSAEFRQRKISAWDEDLGSRKILQNEKDLIWYPAEVNTSIRPGWFYHTYEDDKVRSVEDLMNVYINSVGGNATFLLNIPPTPQGLFHQNDVQRLKELGEEINKCFGNPFLQLDFPKAVDSDGKHFIIEIPQNQKISYIILKEDISQSQRIENFFVTALINGENIKLYEGTIVGYKKIIKLSKPVAISKLYIDILESRCNPIVSYIGLTSLDF